MFNIQGNKSYKVASVYGGTSQKGTSYTFITIESEIVGNSKYPDRLKINVWGTDLSNKVKKDDFIKILEAKEVGITKVKAKDGDKWYENLTIVCDATDIALGDKPATKEVVEQTEMTPIDIPDSDLPF